MATLRKLVLGIGLTLLLLAILEVACAIGFRIVGEESKADAIDARIHADAYGNAPWARAYFEEHERADVMRWEPYVYWRRREFHGEHIDVDAAGRRRTIQAVDASATNASRPVVWLFGGSTMWGTGVRDRGTIPSFLATALAARGVVAEVVNFGESGYVSTQEMIALEVELRQGRVPTVAVFFDGVNDVFSTYQQEVAGIPQNEMNRRRELNLTKTQNLAGLRAAAIGRTIEELALVRALTNGLRAIGAIGKSSSGRRDRDVDALARDTAAIYAGNLRILRALAREYDFELLACLQPSLFQKPRRTRSETISYEHDGKLEPLLVATYARIREGAALDPSFRDLSEVFATNSESLFIDWCHVAEDGNRILAERVADDVLRSLSAR